MDNLKELEARAKEIRVNILEMLGDLGSGHIGGCLSIADVLAVLYFDVMNVDPSDPKKEDRDYMVLSKGHAGPALYAALAAKGYFDRKELFTLNRGGTHLPSHCDRQKTTGIDMTTGSLGQGLSAAVGMAAGLKLKNLSSYVFCIIGDGESQEGQIWEAGMFAAAKKLDNLIVFTDRNKLQIDGPVNEIISLGNLQDKWNSFGWNTITVDGHNIPAIQAAIAVSMSTVGKPSMIILDTIKGKGVAEFENQVSSHHAAISKEQAERAIALL